MKICAISDLHGNLPVIKECDYVLIAGDFVDIYTQRDIPKSIVWCFKTFLPWIKNLPCKEVILVAGNHDFIAQENHAMMHALEYLSDFKFNYVENDYTVIYDKELKPLTIFGTPLCHKFGNWAFMKDDKALESAFEKIIKEVDIILCHDAPAIGNLDLLPPSQWNINWLHAGSKPLANLIKKVKPKYVFFGHLHTCKDKYLELDGTKFYNVSIVDNQYNCVYEPTYVEIN